MGFLTADETERVELGQGKDGVDYWVDIKTALTKTEFDLVQKILTRGSEKVIIDNNRKSTTEISLNSVEYQTEMLVRSIVDWNLTDEDDKPLPRVPNERLRASLGRIPQRYIAMLNKRVTELNNPRSKEETKSFRDESQRSDQPEAVGYSTADAPEVLAGSGPVGSSGLTSL